MVAASPQSQQISQNVAGELTKSFDSAEAVAQQYPQYATQITAAAKTSFLQGDQWAYTAGIVAVLAGGVLVWFFFPRRDDERTLTEGACQRERSIFADDALRGLLADATG